MGFEVNQVFNLANEITSAEYGSPGAFGAQKLQRFIAWDVQKFTAGIHRERGYIIGSATVQEVIADDGKARKHFRRSRLRCCVSSGARRSLGWIPFKSRAAKWKYSCDKFAGHYFKVWGSYGLSTYKFRAGPFSEDSRGR
ncbi:hypothetical protein [Enterobacter quasiroggenkampii]|uniref:hypothetical protein n=1 Tax=Enterobacter quasiroggenkampii TaxID=2497436 RepID=UPI0020054666|nr:hypothetical protein [Enterobacter quasiroggenkampii]MCK7310522.1 hypothetical protein [Enterobacter quasiroggenkampii]